MHERGPIPPCGALPLAEARRAGTSSRWKGRLAVVGLTALLLASCSRREPTPPPASADSTAAATSVGSSPAESAAPPVPMSSVDPSTCGTVRGVVEVRGTPSVPRLPQVRGDAWCVAHHAAAADSALIVHDGKLANAFVWIESGLERFTFEPPTGKVVLDQRDCVFQPRVLGARVGQPITLLNSDPVLHNVHAKPDHNSDRNVALPGRGNQRDVKFGRPEVMIPVSCDVHPWMRAYIGVVAHPFFAVTADDGRFELGSLPAGRYTLGVWHETLGRREVEFEVAAGSERILDPIVYEAP